MIKLLIIGKVIGGMGRIDGFLGDGNMDSWNIGMDGISG